MQHGCREWHIIYRQLQAQIKFVRHLTEMVTAVQEGNTLPRPKKLSMLKEQLVAPRKEIGFSFADFNPIHLPHEPGVYVDGILPGK